MWPESRANRSQDAAEVRSVGRPMALLGQPLSPQNSSPGGCRHRTRPGVNERGSLAFGYKVPLRAERSSPTTVELSTWANAPPAQSVGYSFQSEAAGAEGEEAVECGSLSSALAIFAMDPWTLDAAASNLFKSPLVKVLESDGVVQSNWLSWNGYSVFFLARSVRHAGSLTRASQPHGHCRRQW